MFSLKYDPVGVAAWDDVSLKTADSQSVSRPHRLTMKQTR